MHKYGAGTVYQRADGKWSGQWSAGKDELGRRVRGTVTADTEAAAWKALTAARGKSSSTIRRRRGGESVAAFLERWLADVVRPTKRERTYWGYRSIVDGHLVPAFGDRALVSLTRRDVQSWVNKQKASPQTIRHRLDCLRGAMSRAVRWGLIDANPAKEIDLPAIPKRQLSAVSHDDVRAILAAVAGSDIAPLVTVAIYTGLRQGELLALRWEDVNLGTHTRIHHSGDGAGDGRAGAGGAAAQGGGASGGAVRQGEASGRGVPRSDRATGDAVAEALLGTVTVHHSLARLPVPHGIRYVLTEPKSARSRRTVPLAAPALAALIELRKAFFTEPVKNGQTVKNTAARKGVGVRLPSSLPPRPTRTDPNMAAEVAADTAEGATR